MQQTHEMTDAATRMLAEVLFSEDAEAATTEMLNIVKWFISRSDEEKKMPVVDLAKLYREEVMSA